MSATPWICGSCRSINQPREGRCYRCRTPRDLVEADPETLLVAGAGSRPTETIRPTGAYSSSAALAFLTQVLIVAAIAVTVIANVLGADLVGRILDGEAVAGDASSTTVAIIGGGGLVVGAAALVAFALWLSRVVGNVPTVGLGWTNVTPQGAIFEALIPGVNLYRVPAVLRDIANRLEPGGRGEALIAGTWLGLVGGVLLPRLLSWAIIFVVGSIDEFVAMRVLVGQLALGLTIVGAIILIALIRWIEAQMSARAGGAAGPAAPPPAATLDATILAHSQPTTFASSAVESSAQPPSGAHPAATTPTFQVVAPPVTTPPTSTPPRAASAPAAPAAAAPAGPAPAAPAPAAPAPSLAPSAHWTDAVRSASRPALEAERARDPARPEAG